MVPGDGGPRHMVALGGEGDNPPSTLPAMEEARGGLHGSEGEAVPRTPPPRAAV